MAVALAVEVTVGVWDDVCVLVLVLDTVEDGDGVPAPVSVLEALGVCVTVPVAEGLELAVDEREDVAVAV